jgi:hypothetical protein
LRNGGCEMLLISVLSPDVLTIPVMTRERFMLSTSSMELTVILFELRVLFIVRRANTSGDAETATVLKIRIQHKIPVIQDAGLIPDHRVVRLFFPLLFPVISPLFQIFVSCHQIPRFTCAGSYGILPGILRSAAHRECKELIQRYSSTFARRYSGPVRL